MKSAWLSSVLLAWVLAGGVNATDYTWNGSSGPWNDAARWTPSGGPPAAVTDTGTVGAGVAQANTNLGTSGNQPTIQVNTGGKVQLQMGTSGHTFVLAGGTIGMSSPGRFGTYTMTDTFRVQPTGTFEANGDTSVLYVNGPVADGTAAGKVLITSLVPTGGGACYVAFNGAIPNTYSGGTEIISGGLQAYAAGCLGSGDVLVRSAAMLQVGIAGTTASTARITVNGGGYLQYGQATAPANSMLNSAGHSVELLDGSEVKVVQPGRWGSCTTTDTFTVAGTAGFRCASDSGSLYLAGSIADGASAGKIAFRTQYIPTDGGYHVRTANIHTAGTLVENGARVWVENAAGLGSGPIKVLQGGSLYLDLATSANWTLGNDLAGAGTVQVETGSGYSLSLSGAVTAGDPVGTLSVQGNLSLLAGASLNVRLDATNPLSPVCSVLATSGTLSGPGNTTLNVTISGDTNVLAGREFTIVTCGNDLTGQAFAAVNVPAGWDKVMLFGPGNARVILFPQGAALPVMQLSPTTQSYDLKSFQALPAPQAVQVKNLGGGTLAWTATVKAPAPSWLSLTNAGGTDNGSFLVQINHQGLTGGTYSGYIDVTDPTAINAPQTVAITMKVTMQDADVAIASSYDDAWQTGVDGWVATLRQVRKTWSAKTDGFVTLLGDSITYANPFGQWARFGSGKTTGDTAICNWMHAGNWGNGTNNSNNGWYLAAYDVPGRGGSFTARSGITAGQYLAGFNPPDLPGVDKMFTTGFTNPDGRQYRDAQMAVILLGTNDAGGQPAIAVAASLGSICDKLLAAQVMPVLTTLPPRNGQIPAVQAINTQIISLAQARKLPLIDFYTEVVRRRPDNTWMNTLISSDGVHPSSSGSGYGVTSDPYASNGAALSSVGYLLRGWLTVQKIAEVKNKVFDGYPGDINADGHVDAADLLYLSGGFGKTTGQPGFAACSDLNSDGAIDVVDVLILADDWGR